MMHSLSMDELERRAADQRLDLRNSLSGLHETVKGTLKNRLDLRHLIGQYPGYAAGVAALIGLFIGFKLVATATGHHRHKDR